jgi:hypothetical protein
MIFLNNLICIIMNKINYIFLFCFTFFIAGCINEDDPTPEVSRSVSTPFIASTTSGFYDILNIPTANATFEVDVEGEGTVEKVEVYQSYNGGEPKLVKTIETLPGQVSITLTEASNVAMVDLDELEAGDNFTYTFLTYLDGIAYRAGTFQSVNVACSSNIPVGTYSSITSGSSTDPCPDPNPVNDLSGQVSITSKGDGVYEISDVSAGLYTSWYGGCYGFSGGVVATITDVCNSLTFSGTEPYGSAITGSGTYDSTTGEITFTWSNGFGDTGTATLTKN